MTKLEKSKLDKSKLDISMSGNSGCDPGAIMKGMTEPLKEQFNHLSEETSETSPESTTSSRKFDFGHDEKQGEGLRFRGPAVDPVKIQAVPATGETKPACSNQEDDDGIRHSTTNIHPDHIKPSPVESRLFFKPFEGKPPKMKMSPTLKKRMEDCAKKTASLKKKPISDLSCGHLESSEYWDTHVYGSPREPRDGSSSETEDDPPAMNPNKSAPKLVDPRKFSKQNAKRAWSKITANFHPQSFFCQFRLIEAGQVMYYIGYALLGHMVFVATLLSLFLVYTGTSYFTTGYVVVMVPSEYEDVLAFKRCVVPQEHRLQWVFTFMAIFMFRQFSDFLEAFCKSRVVSFGDSYLSTFILIVEEVVHLCGLWMLVFDVLPDVDLRYGTLSPFCLGMIPSVIGLMTNRFGTKWIFVKQIIISIICVIGQFGLGWIVLRSQDDLLRKMFWCCMAISVKFWDHFVVQPRNSLPNEKNSLMAVLFKLADHKRKWLHSIKLLAFPVKFFCLYILLSQYFGYIGIMPIINLIQQVYPFASGPLQCKTLGPPILSGPTVSLESVPAASYVPYILGMFLFTLPELLKTWGKWVSHMGQHFNLFVLPTFLALLTMHGFAWCVGLENGSVVVAYFVKIFGHRTFSPFLPRNSFSMDNSDLMCLGLIILSSFLCCYSQWLKFLDYYVLQNQFMVKIKPNITPFIFGQNYDFRVTARTDAESMPPAVASRPFIYACATIWREDLHEMSNLVKSLFQIDRACVQLQTACKFEFIIVIDDAFHHASAYKLLGKQVFKLLNVIRRMMRSDAQIPEVTYPTPFGARMEMILPDGGTKLVILLKDTSLVKQGKRFSQALYLNYLVDFQFQDLETMPLPIRNEIVRNKFILTLDGDVNFTPASVFKLLERMTTHPMLSAVCGRIIPTGPCTLWTHAQIYEYAIGHWIQKPVEDCLGSVLCAPGCFSMFRLYDMMETKYHWAYSVSRPHTISMKLRMDQGEDRWMSFLLIAAGGRIGYEPDAICFTECPDTLAKLFGQRRRWITSSFMGVYHFASNLFTQTNQDQLHVGSPAQWYQMFITASTLLSPAVCLMFLVFGFNYTTGISLVASAFLFVMPIAVYAYICHVCEDKVAVLYGCVLSGFFTAPLAMVVISLLQVGYTRGFFIPSVVLLSTMLLQHVLAAISYPAEYSNLLYLPAYMISLPMLYLILPIFSTLTVNPNEWGTRDALLQTSAAEAESEEEGKLKAKPSTFFGNFYFNVKAIMPFTEVGKKKEKKSDFDNRQGRRPLTADQFEKEYKYHFTHIYWARDVPGGSLAPLNQIEQVWWITLLEKIHLKPEMPSPEDVKKEREMIHEFRTSNFLAILFVSVILATILILTNTEDFEIEWPLAYKTTKVIVLSNLENGLFTTRVLERVTPYYISYPYYIISYLLLTVLSFQCIFGLLNGALTFWTRAVSVWSRNYRYRLMANWSKAHRECFAETFIVPSADPLIYFRVKESEYPAYEELNRVDHEEEVIDDWAISRIDNFTVSKKSPDNGDHIQIWCFSCYRQRELHRIAYAYEALTKVQRNRFFTSDEQATIKELMKTRIKDNAKERKLVKKEMFKIWDAKLAKIKSNRKKDQTSAKDKDLQGVENLGYHSD